MPSDESRALADSQSGIVIAPAGCGKTFLLAESVACSSGKQLVLTHTHAGVRAIRGHLERQAVPPAKYRVVTIDGFALRYASAFPSLSGWDVQCPTKDDWKLLRDATHRLLGKHAVRKVLSATYAGVFVDEYQDCSTAQHQLILDLHETLPMRVVGDPLQAIFAVLSSEDYPQWDDVQGRFTLVAELSTPHRWSESNQELGHWLTEVRSRLTQGKDVDLRHSPATWKQPGNQKARGQVAACFGVKPHKGQSAVALRRWRRECHSLARNLRGSFRAMETVECDDLLAWSQKIQESAGAERVISLLDFADTCMSGLPPAVKGIGHRMANGKPPRPQRSDYKAALVALKNVRDNSELQFVLDAMTVITSIRHTLVIGRRELWREMQRAIKEHVCSPAASLQQTAWNLRNRLRYAGSAPDKSALATPLLVKGLEFDHAVILDADDHGTAESLYVAMTRGSRTLTVVSDVPILRRAKPLYLANTEARHSPE